MLLNINSTEDYTLLSLNSLNVSTIIPNIIFNPIVVIITKNDKSNISL